MITVETQPDLADPGSGSLTDPVQFRLDRSELERRWDVARKILAQHELDAVITLGFDDSLSGYLRWFCDFGSLAYTKVAIFFADRPMCVIEHGAMNGSREVAPEEAAHPGVGRILTASTFRSIAGTFTYEAEAVVAELRRAGARRVGLLRRGGMPAAFVDFLEAALPDVAWSDVTEAFDRAKAVKSPVELELLRQACRVQDEVFAELLDRIRPGVREADLLSFAERRLRLRGALDGTVACGSAPRGQSSHLRPWRMVNRVLQAGDCFTVLLELSSEAGYYGEIARQVVLGRASDAQLEAFEIVREAQEATVAGFRPGARCADLATRHDSFMTRRGLQGELRLYSHSQGYDLVERPLMRADETMTLEAGMFLSCHPAIATASAFVFLCDNYIVHADGPAERAHSTPQRLFEV